MKWNLLKNNINITKFGQGSSCILLSRPLVSVNDNLVVFIHILSIAFHMP